MPADRIPHNAQHAKFEEKADTGYTGYNMNEDVLIFLILGLALGGAIDLRMVEDIMEVICLCQSPPNDSNW